MRTLLVVLTAVEILLFLGAVVVYLVRITRSLRSTSLYLGKVTFGVRAIESQTAPIGPSVARINAQLAGVAEALGDLAELGARAPERSAPRRSVKASPIERAVDAVTRRRRDHGG